MVRGALLAFAAVLAALLLGPLAAQAQLPLPAVVATSVTVEVGPVPGPAVPLGPFLTIPVVVRYAFSDVAPPANGSTPVELSVTASPAWSVVTVSPATLLFPIPTTPCGCQQSLEGQASVLLSATQEAPAFQVGNLTVQATARANGAYAASQGEASAGVQAGFLSVLRARVEPATLEGGSAEAREAHLLVTNLGNADTLVRVEAVEAPEGIVPQLPAPATIAPNATGTFVLRFDVHEGAEGVVRLAAHGFLARDTAVVGDTASAALRIAGEALRPESLPQQAATTPAPPPISPVDPGDVAAPLALMPFGLACLALVAYAVRHRDEPDEVRHRVRRAGASGPSRPTPSRAPRRAPSRPAPRPPRART